MSFGIYHDLLIEESPAAVWDAITTPSQLEAWWPLKCSGRPIEGEEYMLFFSQEFDWRGEVVKAEANASFHIRMTTADSNWHSTIFGFNLEQQENHCVVKFFHIEWKSRNDEFRQSSYCWAMLLNGLKQYVEQGIVIPFEKRE